MGGARRRSGRRWLWIVAGIAALGAVAAVVGIWHLPDRMYTDQAARAALQSGLLTAAAALTAVAGGLIALDETRRANANTHVRELYVEAVKLLNDHERGIRLAGIYALERIAVDSPADQRTVVEVLSAFARDRSADPDLRPASPDPASPVRAAVDVHAAVTVLARLPGLAGVPRSDLLGADLTGPAALHRLQAVDGNLAHAQLVGADLTFARLEGANLAFAQLEGADLTSARLFGANLAYARLDGANLAHAGLSVADLSCARLVGADLTSAWLEGVNLAGAELGGANLANAVLHRANLLDALGLSQWQVDVAWGDGQTQLPPGLRRPASWVTGG